jgi:oligopeptidase B
MKGRIKEDDQSVPYLYNGYYYITRFEKGQIILFILEKKEVFLPMKKFYLTVMSWPKDILLSIRRFECESDNKLQVLE